MLHLLCAIASIFVKKGDQKEESSMATEEAEIIDLYDYPPTQITDIVIYPLRSVRGIHVEKAKLTPTGFEYDRVWLCIEKYKNDGSEWRWQNINSAKNLGNTSCRFEDGLYIIFAHPNCTEELKIELNAELKTRKIYKCKNYDGHILEGYYEGEEAEKWFTQALGKHVALIRSFTNPPLGLSGTDEKYIEKYQKYSMNPGHSSGPLHFVTEKSVEDLRSRVDDPDIEITPAQFRPNLVLKGNIAYEEDNMRELVIKDKNSNTIRLSIFKSCTRCKITTFSYKNGCFNENGEPFSTLRKYRTFGNQGNVAFGMYKSLIRLNL